MKDPNVDKDWAEEFDDRFWSGEEMLSPRKSMIACKQFIRETLASHNNSLVERLEGLRMEEKPADISRVGDIGYLLDSTVRRTTNATITEAQELIKNSLTPQSNSL